MFQLPQHSVNGNAGIESKPIRIMWVIALSLVVRFSAIFSVFMAQINISDAAVTSHIKASAIVHVLGCLMQQKQYVLTKYIIGY